METGDGVGAWRFLRQIPAYELAWRAQAGAPAPSGEDPAPEPGEPGPAPGSVPEQVFPVRAQTPADLDAARFDLLAWADPRAESGPASPFWVQDDMAEAAIVADAPSLAGVVAAGGGSIEGLRLLDGSLVLKIEHEEAAVQILLCAAGPFPEGGGIELRHPFGLRMPHGMRRLLDFWQVAGRPPPSPGDRTGKTATWPS